MSEVPGALKKFKFKVEITGYIIDSEPEFACQRVQHGISVAAGIMNGPTETKVSILEDSAIIKPTNGHFDNMIKGKK